MTAQQIPLKKLPLLLATGVLSSGLLLSGCSNSETADSVKTEKAPDATAVNTENANDGNLHEGKVNPAPQPSPSNKELVSKTISPIAAAAKQPSLLTNPTEAGTAEDTVKLALDTLYYGDVEKAASYYQVDMENFAEELKNTQFAFQQTVESVTITDTKYNEDKTRATVTGELRLKDQDQPAPLTYELQKIKGNWKILG